MSEFKLSRLEAVNNLSYNFLKLSIDGKCQIDEFEKSLIQKCDISALKSIYATMDMFSDNIRLPMKKFRHILSKKRDATDIYEFKKDLLRVYVRIIKPDIIVVLGGYKKNQDNDIAKVMRIVQDFDKQ